MLTPQEKIIRHREAKRRWQKNNRARYNGYRRLWRQKKRNEALTDKHCLLCEILMVDNAYGTRLYCRDCVDRFKQRTKNHNKRYRRKLNKVV